VSGLSSRHILQSKLGGRLSDLLEHDDYMMLLSFCQLLLKYEQSEYYVGIVQKKFFNHNLLLIKLMEQEKTKSNKTEIMVFIILVIAVVGYFYFSKDQKSFTGGKQATTPSFTDYGQPLSEDMINCEFKVISSFVYGNKKDTLSEENRKVYYETSEESKPNLITFAGLSTEEPKMKGNLGDTPLAVLKNDAESIVLAEQNAFGEMFVYTIFKKERVATWYKAYKLVATPYGMISMGYCY